MDVRSLVTFWPVVVFSMTAVPEVVEDAVTVTVTESPAENEMPVKSCAESGSHSYHAEEQKSKNQLSINVRV